MAAGIPNKVPYFILISALVLVRIRSAASLSFTITNFQQYESKLRFGNGTDYSNDAVIQNGSLVLTHLKNQTTGRATYSDSVHLWDAESGSLADFSTHFSFVVDSSGLTPYGDGMAFFLAPVDFPVPDSQDGSGLGIVSGPYVYNSTLYPFVAVEFDTSYSPEVMSYANGEYADTGGNHVGIDVSSMVSVAATGWRSGVEDGKLCEAWIDYKAATQELSVVFTGFSRNATVLQSLNYTTDLRKILPEYVCIGFGAATGSSSEMHIVKTWNFSSHLVVDEKVSDVSGRRTRSRTGLAVGVACGAVAAVAVIVALAGLFVVWSRRRCGGKEIPIGMDEEFEKQTGPKKYRYKTLARATRQFDSKNKLGQGGFGGVYKGLIKGKEVAVKRVSRGSHQGVKEYVAEVRVISQLRHRNLVQLIGWCHEGKELLLVYQFLPNGSLDLHLFKSEIALSWTLRYQIAQGLASALLYLHEGCENCIVHRDIKPSNVMLDSSFIAKLGDFGLARIVDHGKESKTTMLAGTRGYIDPVSVTTGKTTKQSDVYSFGIVALEIACGRKPIDVQAPENEVNLVDWVYDLKQDGKLLIAADPKLGELYDAKELECLMIVGLWCAQPSQDSRPSMRQVNLVLNFETPLPDLPARVPVPLPFSDKQSQTSTGTNTDSSMAASGSSLMSSS